MDEHAVRYLTKRRDQAEHGARQALAAIHDILARGDVPSGSDWANLARTATEGATYTAQTEAFTAALDAIRSA